MEMRSFLKWRKPSLSDDELARTNRWLKEAFERETERVLGERPRGLADRCLNVARPERPRAHPWLVRPAFAWVVVVLVTAMIARLVTWQHRSIPVQSSSEQGSGAPV